MIAFDDIRHRRPVWEADPMASKLIIVAMLLCSGLHSVASAESPKAFDDLSAIYEREIAAPDVSIDSSERMNAVAQVYKGYFSSEKLVVGGLDDDDLQASARAALTLGFYAGFYAYHRRDDYLKDARSRFGELQHRNLASDRDYAMMYDLLITARSFDEASVLRSARPTLMERMVPRVRIPPAFDPEQAGEWVLDSNVFVARNIDVDAPLRIVVSAGCHFSRDAARFIDETPELREAFRKGNAVWLGSAGELDTEHVADWNRALPRQPLAIAYDHAAWSDVDFSSQPKFHFFKNGRLVATHDGWRPEGFRESIIVALRKMGLVEIHPEMRRSQ
jgi:hypothetical protein